MLLPEDVLLEIELEMKASFHARHQVLESRQRRKKGYYMSDCSLCFID